MNAPSIQTRCDATRPRATWRRSSLASLSSRPVPVPVPPPNPRPTVLDYLKRAAFAAVALVALTAVSASSRARVRGRSPYRSGLLFWLYRGSSTWDSGADSVCRVWDLRSRDPWRDGRRLRCCVQAPREPVGTAARVLEFVRSASLRRAAIVLVPVAVCGLVVNIGYVFATTVDALYGNHGRPCDLEAISRSSGTSGHPIHLNHFYVSFYAEHATWAWPRGVGFRPSSEATTASSTIRVLKWAARRRRVHVISPGAVLPRRSLWERFPVVEFDNRTALVIGTAGDEVSPLCSRRTRSTASSGFGRTHRDYRQDR